MHISFDVHHIFENVFSHSTTLLNTNESRNLNFGKFVLVLHSEVIQISTEIAFATYNDGADIHIPILDVMSTKVRQQPSKKY